MRKYLGGIIMFKKCYIISGFKGGKEIFRELEYLNLFEAIIMKFRLNKWNRTNQSIFKIERFEKRRIRV